MSGWVEQVRVGGGGDPGGGGLFEKHKDKRYCECAHSVTAQER